MRYEEMYNEGAIFETDEQTDSLTADELREMIANEGYLVVRHVAEPGREACGQIVLKQAEILREVSS
jgi:hypothetical protein